MPEKTQNAETPIKCHYDRERSVAGSNPDTKGMPRVKIAPAVRKDYL